MTIAAGFRARDGILLCADSQYTGLEKGYRKKIFTEGCGAFHVAFALCGDEDYAKTAIADSFQAVRTVPDGSRIWEARKVIRRAIKRVIVDYDDRGLDPGSRPAFLISISNEAERELFSSRDTAIPPVDSYACLGSGAYLGNYFAATLQPDSFMPLWYLVPIALQILSATKRHDAYVGGGSQFTVVQGMGSRGVFFSDENLLDVHVRDFEAHCGKLLLDCSNVQIDEEEFLLRAAKFSGYMEGVRSWIKNPDSPYQKLLRALSLTSPPSPQVTTISQLPPPPSPESREGSGES